jgi:hypothetical protein
MALKWLIVPVVVFGAFVTLVYVAQRLLQYFPERRRTAPSAIGLANAEEVVLDTTDGERMWPVCVPAQSLRAFMSSIIRWRSGLIASTLMGNSCLG